MPELAELLEKCHPLGIFDALGTTVASSEKKRAMDLANLAPCASPSAEAAVASLAALAASVERYGR